MLDKPEDIKRGEKITIIARGKSIEVRMRGEALSSGAIGDKIRARNIITKKIVEGTIASDGSLEVRL
jgi:flagella basal body P-ring formation protein FlgA